MFRWIKQSLLQLWFSVRRDGIVRYRLLAVIAVTWIMAHGIIKSYEQGQVASMYFDYDGSQELTMPLRILPLGDTITQGRNSHDGNGYRKILMDSLLTARHDPVFIGTLANGNMSNNRHEGHDLVVDLLRDKIFANDILKERPNIVLLHVGTIDMGWHAEEDYWEDTPRRVELMIDGILARVPHVCILVAQILQSILPGFKERISSYNAAIVDIVKKKERSGAQILTVDMSTISVANLSDGAHPNDAGYAMMALKWLDGLQAASRRGFIPPLGEVEIDRDGIEEAYDEVNQTENAQP